MSSCGKWALRSPDGDMRPFRCGSMSCVFESCRWLFWSRRVSLITALVQNKECPLKKFFTLTLDRDIIPIDRSTYERVDAWDYIHNVWSKFRKRMNRRFEDFRYVAILEAHKDKDYPHIHGFTNIWMHQREWSYIWSQCGGGTYVWVEKIEDEKYSEYVCKQIEVARYVGKDQLEKGYKQKKSHRTLWRSKNLKAQFELDKEPGWSIIRETVYEEEKVTPFFQQRLGVNEDGDIMAKTRGSISEEGT